MPGSVAVKKDIMSIQPQDRTIDHIKRSLIPDRLRRKTVKVIWVPVAHFPPGCQFKYLPPLAHIDMSADTCPDTIPDRAVYITIREFELWPFWYGVGYDSRHNVLVVTDGPPG